MPYEISITAEQALALAAWVVPGPDMRPVELSVEGDRLIAAQGDDEHSWGPGGSLAGANLATTCSWCAEAESATYLAGNGHDPECPFRIGEHNSSDQTPLESCICGEHYDCPDGWHYGDDQPCSCTADCALADGDEADDDEQRYPEWTGRDPTTGEVPA